MARHILELNRGFVNKLNLIKRSRFLPIKTLLDLYFKVILPSITYVLGDELLLNFGAKFQR